LFAQHIQASLPREQQIQNHGVELLALRLLQPAPAILHPDAIVPRFAQTLVQRLADHRIVFDDENVHGFSQANARCRTSVE